MYGFKCFYERKTFDVYADSLLAARAKAAAHFKVRPTKEHMISVVLCVKYCQTVMNSTESL